ncbi:MAG TPA: 3-hydroxyacyl-CoA dehydrogenase NAD-binding domain-containing protein [Vicinamibacterales bacterium]|nr:3-hydroxyacyl-CoA dehydrogenase NAD-binding domain-containing protein [Vicinamibacterales bacterium]
MTAIRSVAVLGAGTMGAQIAAHFANAGVPSLLLDVSADVAKQGLDRARKLKPDPFFTPDAWKLITTGSFDELPRIKDVDWITEAVVEQLEIKRALLEKVDQHRRPGSIVSSNTSGISIAALAEGRSDDFRTHWLGTHFFNPPRYLRLLEVIPTAETAQDVLDRVVQFADHHLGKGVVIAKDSPNFIGNHVALYGLMRVLATVASGEYTIEEVDAITGPALGRPNSATFRTMDLAGIDVLAQVVNNLHERLPDARDREMFVLPEFVRKMIERGMVGEKAGKGFYKRVKQPSGESEILTLDPATLEYRPRQSARLGSLEAARSIEDGGERVKALFHGKDRVGAFLRRTLAPTLVYTARVTPCIADSPDDVDRVMRWGFGWDLGPFELADAIGIREVLDAAREADPAVLRDGVPPLFESALSRNRLREGEVPPAAPDLQILRSAKERRRVVKKNAGASLVDLGDGVLCVEFHSKMNAIGGDTVQMLQMGVREASQHFAALVVGNDATNFSAGANLMLVLLEAQEENWDEIDVMVRAFQQSTMALRYSDVPVVVAPGGLTLGGGCEIAMHGDRVQAAAETYMGLVEVGVGLIPAGGGTKEMTARAAEQMPPGTTDYLPPIQRAFETIAFAKVSASGPDAERIGYLSPTDAFTMTRERLIADAKRHALERVRDGYQRPVPRTAIPVGGDAVLAPLKLGVHLAWRAGRISDHDALIGRKLATIMAGGNLPHPTTVSEQALLDLEREAFLSLLGERKTQERIQHTLKTGKPLRN